MSIVVQLIPYLLSLDVYMQSFRAVHLRIVLKPQAQHLSSSCHEHTVLARRVVYHVHDLGTVQRRMFPSSLSESMICTWQKSAEIQRPMVDAPTVVPWPLLVVFLLKVVHEVVCG